MDPSLLVPYYIAMLIWTAALLLTVVGVGRAMGDSNLQAARTACPSGSSHGFNKHHIGRNGLMMRSPHWWRNLANLQMRTRR